MLAAEATRHLPAKLKAFEEYDAADHETGGSEVPHNLSVVVEFREPIVEVQAVSSR